MVSGLPEVGREERIKWVFFWRERRVCLSSQKGIPVEIFEILPWEADQIGFKQDQVRPGELGQWDIFFLLFQTGYQKGVARKVSGLSPEQIAEAERKEQLFSHGVDPDDPQEVAFFRITERMFSGKPANLGEFGS